MPDSGVGTARLARRAAIKLGAAVASASFLALKGTTTARGGPGATYVLVHGAWHGGWAWARLAPMLRAAGHDVFTPTLTGLGDRVHLAHPDIDVDTHVNDVLNLLNFEPLSDVVLVGHSYGGIVVTGVAEQAADRIAQLVYLNGFVPQDGQSLADMVAFTVPGFTDESFRAQAQAVGDGWRLPSFPLERWGVTDPDDVEWMQPRLVDQPLKTFTQKLLVSSPAARALVRTYIHCTNPAEPVLAPFAQRARAEGWNYVELTSAGTDAMVTAPRDLADILLALV